MKRFFGSLLLIFCFAMPGMSQSPVQSFQITYQAMALPGGKQALALNDAGFKFGVTQNGSLQSDNFVSMDGSLSDFMLGYSYRFNFLSKALQNVSPQLNGNSFAFSAHGAAGVDRFAGAQHYSWEADMSVDYDPTASGKFTVNLLRAGAIRAPGYASGVHPLIGVGIKFWP